MLSFIGHGGLRAADGQPKLRCARRPGREADILGKE